MSPMVIQEIIKILIANKQKERNE